jgi:hypothetical protein
MGGVMVAEAILLLFAALFFLAVWQDEGNRQPRPTLARLIVAVQLAAAMWVMVR